MEELKKQNINKIIAVGHAGIEMDKRIAKEVDGVDVVVGGHSSPSIAYAMAHPPENNVIFSHPFVLLIVKLRPNYKILF